MTKIKLCGMMRMEDIEKANALGVDYVGFIFAEKSKRFITEETAAAFRERLDPAIRAVGVFVDAPELYVTRLLKEGIIDVAQLHGAENMAYVKRLQTFTEKPVIKAYRIDDEESAQLANQSNADLVLLDSGSGGTGTVFDWQFLSAVDRPYFLAGGLTPENVGDAVKYLQPYAVDVSSGIETNGVKDMGKMERFVEAVRKGSL